MRPRSFPDGIEHASEALIPAEDHERRLSFTPSQIAEELVDGLAKRFRPGPDLELRDEQIATIIAKQHVGLPFVVERLARHTLEMRVQRHEEHVPE